MVEITIHESGSADYSGCGLGYLRPLDCAVSEGLNGMYSLDVTMSLNDPMCEYISIGAVIVAPVPAAETPEITRITGGTESVTTWVYKVTTNGGNLHLRSGPGTNYKILRKYKNGTLVTVLDRGNSSWYKVVAPDGAKGWMSTSYLAYVRTETVGGTIGETTVVAPKAVRAQPFRIYGLVPGLNTVTAKARHCFYDLSDNMVMPGKFTGTRQEIAAGLLAKCDDPDHGFTAICDGGDSGVIDLTEPKSPVEAILGSEGLIESRGGELMRDWFDVYIVDRLGKNRGVSVRYGKNLKKVDGLIHSDNAATRIIPIGRDKNGNDLYLPERYVEATAEQGLEDWPHPRYSVVRVSDADMGEGLSQSQAYDKMRAHVRALFDNGAAMADASINVDFIDLNAAVSPEDADKLQRLFLGDDVFVRIDPMGITAHMRLVAYVYDCLRKRYRKATLGSVGQNIASTGISAKQLPTAGITASKLANSAVGTKQLGDGAVKSTKIGTAAIGLAHISEAAIDKLSAAAITALIGRFGTISAEEMTTDELYAAMAEIVILMVKSINADTISTDELYAALADVILLRAQEINAGNITTDELAAQYAEIVSLLVESITAGNIEANRLGAVLGEFVNLYAGVGEFDFATIQNLVAKAMALEQGSMDTVYIKNLAVTNANILSATLGNLVIKGDDGRYYRVFIGSRGDISTEEVTVTAGEISAGETASGSQIVETSMNVGSLNASTLQASSAVINTILTTALTADKITAAEALIASATIPALYTTSIQAIGNSLDLSANKSIRLIVGEQPTIHRSKVPPTTANLYDLWIQPVTDYIFQRIDDDAALPKLWLDDEGVLYYSYDDGATAYAMYMDETGALYVDDAAPFALVIGDSGEAVFWMRVKDCDLKAVELRVTDDAIVGTVRKSSAYQGDLSARDANISKAQNAADAAQDSVDQAQVSIEQQIEVVYSQVEQTAERFEVELGKKVGLEELRTYMRYEDGTLELGRSDSRYTTRTSDSGFVVLQDGAVMASMEQNTISGPVVNARRMFTIGEHNIRLGATGHLIFN